MFACAGHRDETSIGTTISPVEHLEQTASTFHDCSNKNNDYYYFTFTTVLHLIALFLLFYTLKSVLRTQHLTSSWLQRHPPPHPRHQHLPTSAQLRETCASVGRALAQERVGVLERGEESYDRSTGDSAGSRRDRGNLCNRDSDCSVFERPIGTDSRLLPTSLPLLPWQRRDERAFSVRRTSSVPTVSSI
jgi:hypothetical protein